MWLRLKSWFRILKETVKEFSADNAMKLSASLAYYTIFSIGPLLLIIIYITGFFLKPERITASIYNQIHDLVGQEGANMVLQISQNLQAQEHNSLFGVIGIVTLVIGATTVFAEIQDSINYIWSIRAKPKRGWLKYLINRLLSFSLIIGIGFLLLVTLLLNTMMDVLTAPLLRFFGSSQVYLFKGLNLGLLFVVTTSLFTIIYKVLPDARVRWRDVLIGASFTSILFMVGKWLIGIYLGNSDLANTYGAAASVIVILLWVYYSATILYFGAEFTKVYALNKGGGIDPYDTAVFIMKREVDEAPYIHHATKDVVMGGRGTAEGPAEQEDEAPASK
jgi:membrane protein